MEFCHAFGIAMATIFISACSTAPTHSTDIGYAELSTLQQQGKAYLIDVRSVEERQIDCVTETDALVQYGPDRFSSVTSEQESAHFIEQVRKMNTTGKEIILLCQYGVRSAFARQALSTVDIPSRSIKGGCLNSSR